MNHYVNTFWEIQDDFVHFRETQNSNNWHGTFDYENSIISIAKGLCGQHKIAQENPVCVISYSYQNIPNTVLQTITKTFLNKVSSVNPLTVPTKDYIIQQASILRKQNDTINANELMKNALNQESINRILRIVPNWTAAAAAAFLMWWGVHGNINLNDPNIIKQKTHEYENFNSIPPNPYAQNVSTNPISVDPINSINEEKQTEINTKTENNEIPSTELNSDVVNTEEWIERIILQESGGNPNARSRVNARGLMQVMPKTWAEQTKKIFNKELSFDQAYDPKINRQVGTAYLKEIQKILRSWMGKEPTIEHILAAYNGGVGTLRKCNYDISKMPRESRDYVKKITNPNHPLKPKKSSTVFNLYKVANNDHEWMGHITDTDRYNTDRYDLYLSMRNAESAISIGFQVNSGQLGVTSGCEYWHFKSSESQLANKAFQDIKKTIQKVHNEIEKNRIKFALILPKFKKSLENLYTEYKETTGVYLVNAAYFIPNEEDWRLSIYGNRYPEYKRETIKDNWLVRTIDPTPKIEVANQKRNKIVKYKYAEQLKNNNHWGKTAQILKQHGFSKQEIAEFNAVFLRHAVRNPS